MRGRPYIGGLTRSPVGGGATGPPVARRRGDRPPWRLWLGPPTGRPWDGRQGPVARWGATGPPLFFLQELRCKFEEKKLHLSPIAPLIGRPGYIFEIFQNRHIFLKF